MISKQIPLSPVMADLGGSKVIYKLQTEHLNDGF